MFERSISDNRRKRIPVMVTLHDGTTLRGSLIGAFSGIGDILADGSGFVEIVNARGDSAHYAKAAICKVEARTTASTDQLKNNQRKSATATPYEVLGVPADATEAQLAEAYYRLSKTYHPDRLSALDLPQEMIEYGAAMQSRINAAFAEARDLISGEKREAGVVAEKIESRTIYEHRPYWVRSEAA